MRYVLDSWAKASHSHLQSAHYLAKQGPAPSFPIYRELFKDVQARIVERSSVLVAAGETHDQILGYIVVEFGDVPVLHYLQVKKELWKNKIATILLKTAKISREEPCIFTFSSPIQSKVKTPSKWVHIPHWLTEKE